MPLYEYRCVKCGTRVEKIQKFSDPPLTKCEKCGGKLESLLSSPAFKFKGSGWYITDYAGKSSPGDSEKIEKEKSDNASLTKNEKGPAEKSGKSSPSETSGSKEPSVAAKSKDSKPRTGK